MDDYRFDTRTKEQFEKDIKERTAVEKAIIKDFARDKGLHFADFGCDNTGEFLEKATSRPDYVVYKLMEVKYSEEWIDTIHLKLYQVNAYKMYGAPILFVNGYNTDNPRFTVMDSEKIIRYPDVIFWGKKCLEIPASDFEWADFKKR